MALTISRWAGDAPPLPVHPTSFPRLTASFHRLADCSGCVGTPGTSWPSSKHGKMMMSRYPCGMRMQLHPMEPIDIYIYIYTSFYFPNLVDSRTAGLLCKGAEFIGADFCGSGVEGSLGVETKSTCWRLFRCIG